MTKEELAMERNEVREILEDFSEELSQINLDKLSRVFCLINGDEKQIAELIKACDETQELLDKQIEATLKLDKENAELKAENQKWKDEWQEQVQKENDESYARTLQTIQLSKAKEIIKTFLGFAEAFGYSPSMDKFVTEAEQFISEVEK